MALLDLGDLLHAGHERALVAGVLDEHLDEGGDVAADPHVVDESGVAPDHPPLLELLEPLVHRRGRELHPPADLGLRQAGILLDEGEDLNVLVVEGHSSRMIIGESAHVPYIIESWLPRPDAIPRRRGGRRLARKTMIRQARGATAGGGAAAEAPGRKAPVQAKVLTRRFVNIHVIAVGGARGPAGGKASTATIETDRAACLPTGGPSGALPPPQPTSGPSFPVPLCGRFIPPRVDQAARPRAMASAGWRSCFGRITRSGRTSAPWTTMHRSGDPKRNEHEPLCGQPSLQRQ
jgi:hypothetical protein